MAFTAKLLQIFGQRFYRTVSLIVFYQPYLGHMTKMAAKIKQRKMSKLYNLSQSYLFLSAED